MTEPPLIRRDKALQKTLAKYRGKPFSWRGCNCIPMLRSHLVSNGHKGLPKLPRYNSAASALRALKATGHDNLEQLLDSLLPRIAPAAMLPGDVALIGGDDEVLDAVVISVGAKVFGWHEEADGAVIITPNHLKAAYRV